MAEVARRVTRLDLLKVVTRLLFMRALLHRRGMQSLGLAGALDVAHGKTGGDNSLIGRHLEYFNCNPNCVPLIAGGVLRLEEEMHAGKPVTPEDIAHFKNALASPLAAMGDQLFLGGLTPLALTLGCIFAIYKIPIGLLAVFLLYNVTLIACRLWGIYFGYAKGWELVDVLSGPQFQRILGVVQGLGAAIGGVLAGVILNRLPHNGQLMLMMGVVLAGAALYLIRREVAASWFAIILFPASALITLLFG